MLSFHLVGFDDVSGRKEEILVCLKLATEEDFVKVLCLNNSSGLEFADIATLPFASSEELRNYLAWFVF